MFKNNNLKIPFILLFNERKRNRSDLNNDEDDTQANDKLLLVFQQGLERMWVIISLIYNDEGLSSIICIHKTNIVVMVLKTTLVCVSVTLPGGCPEFNSKYSILLYFLYLFSYLHI